MMIELRAIADHPATALIAGTVVYLYLFWVAYVAVMGVYRAHLSGRLQGFTKWLAAPLVAVGYIMDVLAQYTLATVFFLDWPAHGEHLVTARLQRYIAKPGGWRRAKAKYICDNLLDPFDPRGEHC